MLFYHGPADDTHRDPYAIQHDRSELYPNGYRVQDARAIMPIPFAAANGTTIKARHKLGYWLASAWIGPPPFERSEVRILNHRLDELAGNFQDFVSW